MSREEGGLKLCVIGDAGCGKTSLLHRLQEGHLAPARPWPILTKKTLLSHLPQELLSLIDYYGVPPPLPTHYSGPGYNSGREYPGHGGQLWHGQEFVTPVTINGTEHNLTCTDPGAAPNDAYWDVERSFALGRLLAYPKTNVFLICFSYGDPESFTSVHRDWIKEVSSHCMGPIPIFLVGLCSDVERKVSDQEVVSALRTVSRIPFQGMFTVSSKTNEGLFELFHEVTRAALLHSQTHVPPLPAPVFKKRTRHPCIIM